MSFVTGVILCVSVCEDEGSGGEDGPPLLFERISDWLASRAEHWMLARLEDSFTGGKHPQMYVSGGGFNYFPEDDFAEPVMALPWKLPENVVLVMQPEDGPTKVYRPAKGWNPPTL
jgi:hypothetical protein